MTALWILAGIIGLVIALAASRRAVHHATALAFGSRLPPFIIGVGLLAIGTDLPEIANSIIASLRDQGDLNVSDSIGSAATQLTLVLGLLPLMVGGFPVGRRRVRVIGALTVLALGLGIIFVANGELSRLDGGLLVAAWIAASAAIWRFAPQASDPVLPVPATRKARHISLALGALMLVGGGAWLTIEALIRVADLIGVPVYVVGFLGASLGTSLPELMVDVTALRSGQRDLAIGDVFGSSLIDATLSIGIGPLIAPTAVSAGLAVRGGLAALAAAAIVTLVLGIRRRHSRLTGALLLALYAGLYVVVLNA
jgi:cation:H+ antiporter